MEYYKVDLTYPHPVAKFESQKLLRPIIRDGTRGGPALAFSSYDRIAVGNAYTLPFRFYYIYLIIYSM